MHYRHHMVESCIVTKLIVANISLVSEFSAVVQPTWELETFCDPLCVAGGPALGCNPVVKNHLYCIMLLVQCWVCVYRAGGDKWWTVFMFVLPSWPSPSSTFLWTTSCSSTLDLSPFIPWSVVCVGVSRAPLTVRLRAARQPAWGPGCLLVVTEWVVWLIGQDDFVQLFVGFKPTVWTVWTSWTETQRNNGENWTMLDVSLRKNDQEGWRIYSRKDDKWGVNIGDESDVFKNEWMERKK